MKLKIKKLDKNVILPSYKTEGAAGMDLRAWNFMNPDYPNVELDEYNLPPFSRVLVRTGISVEIPKGYEIQIRPRSGLALEHCITVLNTPGTIDEDYRGEIGVILMNLSHVYFKIKRGDRIAQMVLNKVEKANVEEVEELSETKRGEGGFNSTGIK